MPGSGYGVADRELFEGCALQAVDTKGRVAIPSDLRAAAERNADTRTIVISVHAEDSCLSAHDTGWSHRKYDRIDKLDQQALDRGEQPSTAPKRRAFGLVERATYDDSGRFVLPPFYRAKAKITKWALFVGSGDTFDIWSPEVLLADEKVDPELKELCLFHMQQKGAM